MWKTIIQTSIQAFGNVLIFGTAAFIIKNFFEKSSTKQIESFKSDLNKDLGEFKNKLELILEEHKTKLEMITFKYSRFHERRLDIFSTLYSKIADLHIYMHELTAYFKFIKENFEKEELDRTMKAQEAFKDFLFCFERNKIYLNENTYSLLTEIRNEYIEILIKYNSAMNLHRSGEITYEIMKEIQERMNKKIPIIRKELEQQIKDLIAIDERTNHLILNKPIETQSQSE